MDQLQTEALRSTTLNNDLEYDENGNPYYRWPPFPKPKEGVVIVPFKDFQPNGLQINMDPDSVEVDGLGIPTVQLRVKHDNAGGGLSKKKKKKTIPIGGTAIKRSTWYEDWAEGEDLRSKHIYNQMLPREDRLLQASEDFKSGRRWPQIATGIPNLYDYFRIFIGLIGNPMRGVYRKKSEEDQEEDDDDDEVEQWVEPVGDKVLPSISHENENSLENKPKKRRPKDEPEKVFDPVEFEEPVLEIKEARLESFLNDPEKAMKIYFSSYFRDRGLLWIVSHLRDSPLLASFYLNFLIRNRALPEFQNDLMKAVEVVDQAKKQLPLTKKLSIMLPDDLATSCVGLFGSKLKPVEWPAQLYSMNEDQDLGQPKNKKPRLDFVSEREDGDADMALGARISMKDMDIETKPRTSEVDVSIMDVDATNAANISEKSPPVSGWENAASTTVFESETSGLGAPKPQLIIDENGWGIGSDTAINWPDDGDNQDPWNVTETVWPEMPKPFLMSFIGPSLFPLLTTTGYVERSTRRIASWTIPSLTSDNQPTVPVDLRSLFAAIVLAPWGTYDSDENAAVKTPEIIYEPANDADREKIRVHQPMQDHITLLADPKIAEFLYAGMGIGGTFVQVVPKLNSDEMSNPMSTGSGSGSGRKISENNRRVGSNNRDRGKTATRKDSTSQSWWYIEQLEQVLPSYWTERSD